MNTLEAPLNRHVKLLRERAFSRPSESYDPDPDKRQAPIRPYDQKIILRSVFNPIRGDCGRSTASKR